MPVAPSLHDRPGEIVPRELAFSLDSHIAEQARGTLIFIRMGDVDHPRMSPGDILIIEQMSDGDDRHCTDKSLLLIEYDGKYILRQKKFVRTLLRRAKMHVVGSETHSRIIVIGRVVGWSLGTFHSITMVVAV